ncbi:MAG: hypothetical protein LBU37_15640, partial [Tannerellaceae bacterium]|nr:hypothetical protein [Tannerellaceae bacterium]
NEARGVAVCNEKTATTNQISSTNNPSYTATITVIAITGVYVQSGTFTMEDGSITVNMIDYDLDINAADVKAEINVTGYSVPPYSSELAPLAQASATGDVFVAAVYNTDDGTHDLGIFTMNGGQIIYNEAGHPSSIINNSSIAIDTRLLLRNSAGGVHASGNLQYQYGHTLYLSHVHGTFIMNDGFMGNNVGFTTSKVPGEDSNDGKVQVVKSYYGELIHNGGVIIHE